MCGCGQNYTNLYTNYDQYYQNYAMCNNDEQCCSKYFGYNNLMYQSCINNFK